MTTLVLAALALPACGDKDDNIPPWDQDCSIPVNDALDYAPIGDYAVGTTTFTLPADDAAPYPRRIQLWYPATEPGDTTLTLADYVSGDDRVEFEAAIDEAPEGCIVEETFTYADLPVAQSPNQFPLLLFSHCLGCTRFSSLNIMASLASHGYVVASADHLQTSWFERENVSAASLTAEALAIRTADMRAMLDALTSETIDAPALVQDIHAMVDIQRVGALGHSFGSITSANLVTTTQADRRIHAWAGLAAPPSALVGPKVSEFNIPALLLIAQEDNSITSIGNLLIETDYKKLPAPKFLLSFPDMGHFSITHISGLGGEMMEGCGEGLRQTNRQPFVYPDARLEMERSAIALVAFFDFALNGERRAPRTLYCDTGATTKGELKD